MLPENIELEVVTPQKHVLHETVQSIEMPGKDGYLGILPGHAPLLTELGLGILTYSKSGDTRKLTVMNGYAEVLPDRVTVLAELSERPEEIDVGRAQAKRDQAQAELAKAGSPEVNWEEAALRLQRALIRLQVASRSGGGAGH
jgi:F-type H+-transporting ATPase subunit epsilon